MSDTIILGAGLAGLGCARHSGNARVFEAAPHVGGHVWSHEMGGAHFDEGAHICHSPDEAWTTELFKHAGAVEHIEASRVANYWKGHWVTYPVQNHLHTLPVEARMKALSDFVNAQREFAGKTPANYDEWCLYQYGSYLRDNFYALYTDKYWRVPMRDLTTDWLAGRLLPSQVDRIVRGAIAPQPELQSTFARFHYPSTGGFFRFFSGMYKNIDVTLGARAVAVDPVRREVRFADGRSESYRNLVSTIPLNELVAMTNGAPDAVQRAAMQLRYTHLMCVNMIVRRTSLAPYHWFYIYDEDIETARVSLLSNIAKGDGLEDCSVIQAEIYRRGDETFNEARITADAVRDVGRVLGFDPGKDLISVGAVHVPHAYIISDHQRAGCVNVISDWLETQGIVTAGLFGSWQFIWSDKAYSAGKKAAERVAARPATSSRR